MTYIERLVIILEHRNVLDQYAGGSSLGGFLVTMVLISFLCHNKRGWI